MPRFGVVVLIALAACSDPPATQDAAPADATAADATPADATPADVTPPDTTITGAPLAISDPSVTFLLEASEPGGTFWCGLDGAAFTPCDASTAYTGLAAGSHTFLAAAQDASGNQDPTPAEHTWTVDPNALETTIDSGPAATAGPGPVFTFSSTRAGTFECRLDPIDGAFAACTSPKTYASLGELGYTFQVRAIDTAGNVDATPAAQSFAVDATGPSITITSPTADAIVGTTVTLTFTTEPGATYACQLDAGAIVSPCASGQTFGALTSAFAHALAVVGTDALGNTTTQNVDFTADDTGPGVTVSGTPASGATVATTSASLTFTPIPSDEPAGFSFECRFNTAAVFTPCTAGFATSGLIEGTQTLRVRAKDQFDNVGGVVTYTWTISATNKTIFQIRTTPVAAGTRVRVTNARVTAKTNNRFWMQEIDGASVSPAPQDRGITVMPTNFNASDVNVRPGETMTVIGTVAEVNGNTTLVNASYVPGSLLTAYSPVPTGRDSVLVLLEQYEGMLVSTAGNVPASPADVACDDFDYCIQSCDRVTPLIHVIDGASTITVGADQDFIGLLEGDGAGFHYFVTVATANSSACL